MSVTFLTNVDKEELQCQIDVLKENTTGTTDYNDLENIPCCAIIKDTVKLTDYTGDLSEETYVKVSDAIPTLEELGKGFTIAYNYQGDELTATYPESATIEDFTNGYYLKVGGIYLVRIYTQDVGTRYSKGVYFANYPTTSVVSSIMVTRSLQINDYAGFSRFKKLDSVMIPDEVPKVDTASVGQIVKVKAVDENGKPTEWEAVDMPSGETDYTKLENKPTETIGGDTLTWDGNTEGLEVVPDSKLYRVTEVAPTITDFTNGATFVLSNGEVYEDMPTDTGSDLLLGLDGAYAVFVSDMTNPDTGETVKKGTYLIADTDNNVVLTSLTIPNYTGFSKEVLKEEALPEHTHDVQTSFYINMEDAYLYTDKECTTKATKADVVLASESSLLCVQLYMDGVVLVQYYPMLINFAAEYAEILTLLGVGETELDQMHATFYTAEYTAT